MSRKLLLFAAMLSAAVCTDRSWGQSDRFDTGKYLEIQSAMLRAINDQYVDTVRLDDLLETGINAMLASLDPYTVFIPEEDEENLDMLTTGSYGGVGAIIQKLPTGEILISEPYEGSAAVKCGLQPGDRIIAIDGKSTDSLSVSQSSEMMRGRPGTVLNMEIVKVRTGDTVSIDLVRERIHINDVVYYGMLDDSTGYIRIGGFTLDGHKDVGNALDTLRKNGRMKRLVMDLRYNGGGLLKEAVDILSFFLPEGTEVVSAKGKHRNSSFSHRTTGAPVDTVMPMLVMVNSSSASSSEIIAGALQDLDRAVIAGNRTYGKGLVQSIRPLAYNTSLKLTTAKYYTPSGRCVQAIDYTHRNADGSAGAVPDSLKKTFHTSKGRPVYDGGGITPDIDIEAQYYSRPIISLIYSGILSDFAIEYYSGHESVPSPSELTLTDEDYEDFIKFASGKEFDSRTESEIEMENVLKAFRREGLGDDIEGADEAIEALKDRLSLSKEEFLRANRDIIRHLLEDEIAIKYYFQRGGTESALRWDTQLQEAVEKWDTVKL